MLDSDLAELYGVEVRQLKRQVRRNRKRFPSDFMLVLSREERDFLRCQIGTLRWGAHAKYSPFAFTEQGVAMLSSVLNSPRAIRVNIAIMRAFVKLREILAGHSELSKQMEEIERRLTGHDVRLDEHGEDIRKVFEAIRKLMAPPEPPPEPQRRIPGFRP